MVKLIKEKFDTNSLLISILLMLSIWTLKTVTDLRETTAVIIGRVDRNEKDIVTLALRANEANNRMLERRAP